MGGTKPGLWTLDWTMDWTMDWIMDSILDFWTWTEQHYVRTNLVFGNFPGLSTVQFLIASSRVPKVRFLYIFSAYMAALKPRQCIGR